MLGAPKEEELPSSWLRSRGVMLEVGVVSSLKTSVSPTVMRVSPNPLRLLSLRAIDSPAGP